MISFKIFTLITCFCIVLSAPIQQQSDYPEINREDLIGQYIVLRYSENQKLKQKYPISVQIEEKMIYVRGCNNYKTQFYYEKRYWYAYPFQLQDQQEYWVCENVDNDFKANIGILGSDQIRLKDDDKLEFISKYFGTVILVIQRGKIQTDFVYERVPYNQKSKSSNLEGLYITNQINPIIDRKNIQQTPIYIVVKRYFVHIFGCIQYRIRYQYNFVTNQFQVGHFQKRKDSEFFDQCLQQNDFARVVMRALDKIYYMKKQIKWIIFYQKIDGKMVKIIDFKKLVSENEEQLIKQDNDEDFEVYTLRGW